MCPCQPKERCKRFAYLRIRRSIAVAGPDGEQKELFVENSTDKYHRVRVELHKLLLHHYADSQEGETKRCRQVDIIISKKRCQQVDIISKRNYNNTMKTFLQHVQSWTGGDEFPQHNNRTLATVLLCPVTEPPCRPPTWVVQRWSKAGGLKRIKRAVDRELLTENCRESSQVQKVKRSEEGQEI